MIAFFDPEDIVQTMGVQGLDVGGIRTQAVFSDNEFEVRVVLAQPGNEPVRGIPFTVCLSVPSCFTIGSGQRNHCTHIRMDNCCA